MIVEALLAHGADGRAPDDTGKPPVVYAAAGGRLDIVKRLLALQIDINARYANDLTLLMWASGPDEKVPEAQAIQVVSYLLDAGAHIDDRDDRGRTALMIAAEGGHAEIANLLLAARRRCRRSRTRPASAPPISRCCRRCASAEPHRFSSDALP